MMKKKICISLAVLLGFICFIIADNIIERESQEKIRQTEIDLLISTGGDPLRKTYIQEAVNRFQKKNSSYQLHITFVESDTLAFLKLLYSEGEQKYDIVGLGEESVVSASEQGLVYPLDDFVLEDFGFSWLNETLSADMTNTVSRGNMYSLPFIKSDLYYYTRAGEIQGDKITIWEVLEESSEKGKIGIPAYVILKDMLLSREPGPWEMENEKIPYKVNTCSNQELLQLLDRGRYGHVVFEENYESAIDDYLKGRTDGIVLDESYENMLIDETGAVPDKGRLFLTNSSPWFLQGCNLFLVKKQNSQGYEEPWYVLKGLVEEQMDRRQDSREGEKMAYKRISSRYNPKIQLIVDRMISEFLHGDHDVSKLLENLENQVQNIQETRWQE